MHDDSNHGEKHFIQIQLSSSLYKSPFIDCGKEEEDKKSRRLKFHVRAGIRLLEVHCLLTWLLW